jgi:hypothetical protein
MVLRFLKYILVDSCGLPNYRQREQQALDNIVGGYLATQEAGVAFRRSSGRKGFMTETDIALERERILKPTYLERIKEKIQQYRSKF